MQGALIDSNILLDIFEDDLSWAEWSVGQLEEISATYKLLINPVIYSELSIGFQRIEELELVLQKSGIRIQQIPKEALFLAGKVFLEYKKRGGTRRSPLPDFFIGAHAAVFEHILVTRDYKRYKTYFPTIKIIHP